MRKIFTLSFVCSVAVLVGVILHQDRQNIALINDNLTLQTYLRGSSASGCGSDVQFQYSIDGTHWATIFCGPNLPAATPKKAKAGAHSEPTRKPVTERSK